MPSRTGKRIPTMYDVAMVAGVSVATVSHVLNPESDKYVSDELRQRILAAVQDLGYRPNILARCMRGKRRKTIAILVPQFENILFTRTVMAAEQVAYDAGYVLLICSTYDNPGRERVYIETLISQQVDGFIIAPTVDGTANTKPLRDLKIPYVILDRQLSGIPLDSYDYIGFDNQKGAELATQYLIDRGHRAIAFIGWKSKIKRINERYAGFRSTVIKNGLRTGDCPALLGQISREEGYRMAEQLFAEGEITAVFAGHQYLGEGILQAIHDRGKLIPRDISLVVYGGPDWTELVNPKLTHIEMPDIQLGEPAARNLIHRIEGDRARPEQLILDPTLKLGASVADGPGLIRLNDENKSLMFR
ncbi:LacI family transcriptional regulator [Hydrogenispora ethanolica]|uniref:LacI family transcriptional regulator n=2 Tax=Hydrogenispora ethanolica TaxID=1082276 RepID=A0A4R1RSE0_HYDET|nr:LacI family transcriptional regulator [Hydrogenispora ethanolica]